MIRGQDNVSRECRVPNRVFGCSRLLQQQPSATSSQQQAGSSEAASSKPSSRTAGAASSSREQPSDQLPNTVYILHAVKCVMWLLVCK